MCQKGGARMTTNCGRGSPALPLAADPVGKLTLHLRGAEPQHWCVLVSLSSCHLLALHVMSLGFPACSATQASYEATGSQGVSGVHFESTCDCYKLLCRLLGTNWRAYLECSQGSRRYRCGVCSLREQPNPFCYSSCPASFLSGFRV